MGGNVWIAEEEVVFWEEIAVHASCHGSIAIAEPKSWKELSVIMRRKMTSRLQPGEVLRRKYTPTSCQEHYFWTFTKKKISPNAGPFLAAYEKKVEERKAMLAQGQKIIPTTNYDRESRLTDAHNVSTTPATPLILNPPIPSPPAPNRPARAPRTRTRRARVRAPPARAPSIPNPPVRNPSTIDPSALLYRPEPPAEPEEPWTHFSWNVGMGGSPHPAQQVYQHVQPVYGDGSATPNVQDGSVTSIHQQQQYLQREAGPPAGPEEPWARLSWNGGMGYSPHPAQQVYQHVQPVHGDGSGGGDKQANPNAQNGGMKSIHQQQQYPQQQHLQREERNENAAEVVTGSAANAHGHGHANDTGNGSGDQRTKVMTMNDLVYSRGNYVEMTPQGQANYKRVEKELQARGEFVPVPSDWAQLAEKEEVPPPAAATTIDPAKAKEIYEEMYEFFEFDAASAPAHNGGEEDESEIRW